MASNLIIIANWTKLTDFGYLLYIWEKYRTTDNLKCSFKYLQYINSKRVSMTSYRHIYVCIINPKSGYIFLLYPMKCLILTPHTPKFEAQKTYCIYLHCTNWSRYQFRSNWLLYICIIISEYKLIRRTPWSYSNHVLSMDHWIIPGPETRTWSHGHWCHSRDWKRFFGHWK